MNSTKVTKFSTSLNLDKYLVDAESIPEKIESNTYFSRPSSRASKRKNIHKLSNIIIPPSYSKSIKNIQTFFEPEDKNADDFRISQIIKRVDSQSSLTSIIDRSELETKPFSRRSTLFRDSSSIDLFQENLNLSYSSSCQNTENETAHNENIISFQNFQLTEFPTRHHFNLSFITEINISNNYISELPSEFGQCKELRTLIISNNKISDFPPEFQMCKELRLLKMDNNNFSRIPKCIKSFQKLESLDISHNKLKKIDLISLSHLNLQSNEISHIPLFLGKLFPTLSRFQIENNPLDHPSFMLLLPILDKTKKFRSVKIRESKSYSNHRSLNSNKSNNIPQITNSECEFGMIEATDIHNEPEASPNFNPPDTATTLVPDSEYPKTPTENNVSYYNNSNENKFLTPENKKKPKLSTNSLQSQSKNKPDLFACDIDNQDDFFNTSIVNSPTFGTQNFEQILMKNNEILFDLRVFESNDDTGASDSNLNSNYNSRTEFEFSLKESNFVNSCKTIDSGAHLDFSEQSNFKSDSYSTEKKIPGYKKAEVIPKIPEIINIKNVPISNSTEKVFDVVDNAENIKKSVILEFSRSDVNFGNPFLQKVDYVFDSKKNDTANNQDSSNLLGKSNNNTDYTEKKKNTRSNFFKSGLEKTSSKLFKFANDSKSREEKRYYGSVAKLNKIFLGLDNGGDQVKINNGQLKYKEIVNSSFYHKLHKSSHTKSKVIYDEKYDSKNERINAMRDETGTATSSKYFEIKRINSYSNFNDLDLQSDNISELFSSTCSSISDSELYSDSDSLISLEGQKMKSRISINFRDSIDEIEEVQTDFKNLSVHKNKIKLHKILEDLRDAWDLDIESSESFEIKKLLKERVWKKSERASFDHQLISKKISQEMYIKVATELIETEVMYNNMLHEVIKPLYN
ncbi:Leucine-rich repeat protein soc-2-like protein [Smittium culicis]|uniref:Leucine-rich repeat protein soc-2-like protein n=1 Tax=Smittium culicis TaxID=133412 RepID=A0A1R1XFM9_9FUNG|nr:Leucine-rich repeat protein soc-2-like protein [Smittium culicis]